MEDVYKCCDLLFLTVKKEIERGLEHNAVEWLYAIKTIIYNLLDIKGSDEVRYKNIIRGRNFYQYISDKFLDTYKVAAYHHMSLTQKSMITIIGGIATDLRQKDWENGDFDLLPLSKPLLNLLEILEK